MPNTATSHPRSAMSQTPMAVAARKAPMASPKASRSVRRPFTSAWLARGDVIESMPLRTS